MCICMYIQCVSSEKECGRVCEENNKGKKRIVAIRECSSRAASTGESMSLVYKMCDEKKKIVPGFSKGVYGTTTWVYFLGNKSTCE